MAVAGFKSLIGPSVHLVAEPEPKVLGLGLCR